MDNSTKTAARPMYVALYCRVASADAFSLEAQESRLVHYAESTGYESGAYNVHHVYRDNGESGLTLDRLAMNKLMADIRDGRVDAVIVKDLSRISRYFIQTEEWIRFLRKHKVRLVSVADGILNR